MSFLEEEYKEPEDFSSAMCEMAWMSFQKPAKMFKKHVVTAEPNKIHPTQKPIMLYDFLYQNYAKEGDKILDTHLGSGSSRIAAYNAGLDFTACEIDKDYFDAQEKRFKNHIMQLSMF